MPEKIEQQFIIDAAQALDQLGKLNASFQTFEGRLRSVANTISQFNSAGQGLGNLSASVRAASQSMQGLQTNTTATGTQLKLLAGARPMLEQLASLTDRAGISFETLSRIIQAQVIVRSINAIRDALIDAVTTAGNLQQQVALVQTIATAAPGADGQRIGVDAKRIAAASREISDALNIPQLEVARGLYDAISNQVGDFAESITFAAEAGKFARATNATLSESVDTLSAVLRSYRLNADQTSRVADILFATIDKGRVTADELANTLGRILPAAAELGVSLEEVGAAVATISVGGLSTDETLTQVRATFSGLLKPSEALSEAFDTIGVASAELGIRTFGFVGLLNKVRDAAGGSSEQLARLFPNVRNLGGVLALTAEQGQLYAETLKDIGDTQGLNEAAFQTVTGTEFEQLTSTVNLAKNALARLGEEIISDAVHFQDLAGGSQAVADGVETLARGVVRLTPVVATAGATMLVTSNAARVLLAALSANPIVLAATGFVTLTIAVREAAQALEDFEKNRINKELDALEEFDARQVEIGLRNIAKGAAIAAKEFDKGLKESLIGATEASKEYLGILPTLKSGNEQIVGSVTDALGDVVSARKDYVRELERAAQDSQRIAERSADRVASLQGRASSNSFDRQIKGLDDPQQVFRLTKRSSELAQKAAAQLQQAAQAGSDQGIARALDLFRESQGLASQAEQIAAATDNRALEANAVKAVTDSLNQQIAAEQVLQRIQRQREAALTAEAKRQASITAEVQRQAKVVLQNTSLFNNQGEQFSASEAAQRTSARNNALSKLVELQFQQGDFDLSKTLGLAEFARKFEAELGRTTTDVQISLANRGSEIANQVSEALGKFNQDPFVARLKAAAGLAISEAITPAQIEDIVSRAESQFRNRTAAQSELQGANLRGSTALKQAQDRIQKLSEQQDARRSKPLFEFTGGSRELSESLAESANELQKLVDAGAGAEQLSDALRVTVAQLEEIERVQQQRGDSSVGGFQIEIEQLQQLNEKFRSYTEEQLKAEAAAIRIEKVDLSSNVGSAANFAFTLAQNTLAAAQAAQQYAAAMRDARNAGTAAEGEATANAAFGGFFAHGGFTRGKDNIPAMLTRGESVLNAAATNRFYAQIQAMNAGQEPVFRGQGGPVTNNSIGDVVVNMSPGADGRMIADTLRRELRLTGRRL